MLPLTAAAARCLLRLPPDAVAAPDDSGTETGAGSQLTLPQEWY
mgnify:CR=1 FL=1